MRKSQSANKSPHVGSRGRITFDQTRQMRQKYPSETTADPFNCREPEPDRERAPTADQQHDDQQQCETEPAE
jgi:hypothetical protein